MITLTTAEINAWIVAYFYPLTRILAFLAVAPPFNNVGMTRRVRLLAGLIFTIAISPTLPKMPPIDPASGQGLLIFAWQLAIGFAMGFSLRLVFSAIDLGGTMISNQMGLGFATSYDPQSGSQTAVIPEFIGMLALLIFLAINGHLMVIATLAKSFDLLPVASSVIEKTSWSNIANAGGVIFSSGVLIALPIVIALLITNIAIGILGRVAPQLNIIAIGFAITMLVGFAALLVAMTYMSAPILQLFDFGLESILGYFVIAG